MFHMLVFLLEEEVFDTQSHSSADCGKDPQVDQEELPSFLAQILRDSQQRLSVHFALPILFDSLHKINKQTINTIETQRQM